MSRLFLQNIALICILVLTPVQGFCMSQIYDSKNEILVLAEDKLYPAMVYGYNEKYKSYLDHKLFILNMKTSETVKVDVGEYIVAVKLGSSGHIAVIGSKETHNEVIYRRLHVFDLSGKEVKLINDVFKSNNFEWSQDGRYLAYFVNRYTDDDLKVLNPETSGFGIWILDISTNETKKVFDFGTPFWNSKKNILYGGFKATISNGGIYDEKGQYKYEPETDKFDLMSNSSMLSISPSEEYAVTLSEFTGPWEPRYIYLSNLSTKENKFTVDSFSPEGKKTRFIDNNLLMIYSSMSFYEIRDIAKNEAIKSGKGLLGWNEDMTRAVVYVGNGNVQIQNMLTGQVLKSFKLPK